MICIQAWECFFFYSDAPPPPPRPKSLRLQKKSPSGDPLPMKAETLYVAKSAVDVAISRKPPGKVI